MKPLLCVLALAVLVAGALAEPPPRHDENLSVRNEVGLAIDKALGWFVRQQQPDGSWSDPAMPALTALPLMALTGNPQPPTDRAAALASASRAANYIRSQAQPDGGIYRKGLTTYNTALCLTALLRARQPQDEPLMAKARDFLAGHQATGGGFGYGGGGARDRPDLSNTVVALEALSAWQASHPAKEGLDWKAALQFVTRCQNMTATDQGGFAYVPEKEGAPAGSFRATGTMTYAGLLSYIYADLPPADPRVKAARDWLQLHYTLEENPGQQRDGYYYYLHLLAKGLGAAKIETLQTAEGKNIAWPHQLALKLINTQSSAGSWVNPDSARWMENDPILVTSYALLTLEMVWREL